VTCPLDAILAKGPRGAAPGETLRRHTLRALDALAGLARRYPDAPRTAGDPRLWHRLFWAAAIHDLGKAAAAFQAMLRGGPPWHHRHEVLSLGFLPLVARPGSEDFAWMAAWVASHHRGAEVILDERYDPALPPVASGLEEMATQIEPALATAVAAWLRAEVAPLAQAWAHLGVEPAARPLEPGETFRIEAEPIRAALLAYAELRTAARAAAPLGPPRQRALVGRGLLMLADRLASCHAPVVGPVPSPDPETIRRRAGFASWNACQRQAAVAHTPARLVAPTGSGKTEAALLWAAQPVHRGQGALVYLLPYQASLNAMMPRLERLLRSPVALLHGHALQALYRRLRDEAAGRDAEAWARHANDLGRLYHPPVWLTTPYHLLRAAYGLPGHPTTWAALQNARVVVDEVHAYEPARLGMIVGLLRALQERWGIRLLVMSATVPTWLAELLDRELGCRPVAVLPEDGAARHRLRLAHGEPTDDAYVETLAWQAATGTRVLVCLNTVNGAVRLWERLRRRLEAISPLTEAVLLHGRFCARDRLRREAALQRAASGSSGCVAVATQVVEVSLDVDFDEGWSELAPPDALVQRMGRVNRRGRKGVAPFHILVGEESLRRAARIYDPEVLAGSERAARDLDGRELTPHDLAAWIEAAYPAPVAHAYTEAVRRSAREFASSCLATLDGFEDAEDSDFERLFAGWEVLPRDLVPEFQCRLEDSVLEASGLLVPLDGHAFRRHAARIAFRRDWRVHVAELHYDPERGLLA
jgi:CRISPR-associated endonuclease/helicase Cas3